MLIAWVCLAISIAGLAGVLIDNFDPHCCTCQKPVSQPSYENFIVLEPLQAGLWIIMSNVCPAKQGASSAWTSSSSEGRGLVSVFCHGVSINLFVLFVCAGRSCLLIYV